MKALNEQRFCTTKSSQVTDCFWGHRRGMGSQAKPTNTWQTIKSTMIGCSTSPEPTRQVGIRSQQIIVDFSFPREVR
jgi:hypothetical protein